MNFFHLFRDKRFKNKRKENSSLHVQITNGRGRIKTNDDMKNVTFICVSLAGQKIAQGLVKWS